MTRRGSRVARVGLRRTGTSRDEWPLASNSGSATRSREASPRLPRGFAWLIRLAPETACGAEQLRYFLADPEVAALLAAAPRMAQALRPLCRMLGVEVARSPESIARARGKPILWFARRCRSRLCPRRPLPPPSRRGAALARRRLTRWRRRPARRRTGGQPSPAGARPRSHSGHNVTIY